MRFPANVTYWAATPDGYGGFSFASPLTIKGRWQDTVMDTINNQGEAIVSRAIVYVNTDVEVNGYLAQGDLDDIDPTLIDGAHRIARFDKSPNIKYSDYLRKVTLV